MPGMRELNAVEPPRRGWRRWLIVGAGVTIARGAGLASRAIARLYGAGAHTLLGHVGCPTDCCVHQLSPGRVQNGRCGVLQRDTHASLRSAEPHHHRAMRIPKEHRYRNRLELAADVARRDSRGDHHHGLARRIRSCRGRVRFQHYGEPKRLYMSTRSRKGAAIS